MGKQNYKLQENKITELRTYWEIDLEGDIIRGRQNERETELEGDRSRGRQN